MNVAARLAENAALVGAALNRALEKQDADFSLLTDAIAYSLLAPRAKRVRPTLVLEFAKLFGGNPEQALPFAVAIEMVHTYSLIHDDLPCMDDDDLRRGRPTCHKAFDEATALLAGDALLTGAFGVLAEAPLPSATICDALRVLADAAGTFGMIGGQVMDLAGEGTLLPLEKLIKLHRHKTGALMVAAAKLGAIAAGVGLADARMDAITKYAEGVGLVFQIVDDVLDVTADAETAGKSVCSDLEKTTFMRYYSPDEALALASEINEEAKAAVRDLPNAAFLIEFADSLLGRRS